MDDIKLKNEVVEKIKASTNILVTVSNDPSVDALSAALGLTMALDKMKKYATAIFSGAVPPAISFLEPEKLFEDNTDSLRDFIIALNKDKADHLRFKPDGEYVKIYITPYKTTIKPEDLEFSQGDFNIELVIALGVDKQEHLDGALNNHGKILHDATVITMSAGDVKSTLGGIDWHDPQVSSLSEMTAGLIEALKESKDAAPLIDAPVATALLTGIVAETDRFSNAHTTSKVMTVAANLMSAGADQQLVASKLQETHEIRAPETSGSVSNIYTESSDPQDGLSVSHDDSSNAQTTEVPQQKEAPATVPVSSEVSSAYAPEGTPPAPTNNPSQPEPEQPAAPEAEKTEAPKDDGPERAYIAEPDPSSAYALNAEGRDSQPEYETPAGFPGTPPVAPGSVAVNDAPAIPEAPSITSAYAPPEPPEEKPEEATPEPQPQPQAQPTPTPPSASPEDLGLPMPPPIPDFSAGASTPQPAAIPIPPTQQPERLGDILAAEGENTPTPPTPLEKEQPASDAPANPAQFKIPGQS